MKTFLNGLFYNLRVNSLIRIFVLMLFTPVVAADPVTFSFASDDEANGPTFHAPAGNVIYGKANLTLFVDINRDLPGGKHLFKSVFSFKAKTYAYEVVPYGSQWMHMWRLYGDYHFQQIGVPGNPVILSSRFAQAVLTSVSTSNIHAGDTFTIQDSESIDPNILMMPHGPLAGIGIGPGALSREEDFTFTLSRIKTNVPPILLTAAGHFTDQWKSEGSFSASGRH